MRACLPAAATSPQRRFLPDFLTDRIFFAALRAPRAGDFRAGRACPERLDWGLPAAADLRRETGGAFAVFGFLLGLACTSSLVVASFSSSFRRRS